MKATLTHVLVLLVSGSGLRSPLPDTPEELLADLRRNVAQVALLNGLALPDLVSYDRLELPIIGPVFEETYDFIIVGAGTAGTLLANRLSENAKWKVLVLEAGGQGDFLSEVPALAPLQQFYSHNWGYLTEKQENMGLGLKEQLMHWPRGKGLGGSSLINYMMYTRGNKKDYDAWAALGNLGWSYKDVLPYFYKFEASRLSFEDVPYRNHLGELSVEDVAYRTISSGCFVNASKNLGYPYVDYNGANQMGVSYIQATTRNGLRCSGEKAFLRPAKIRSNLRVRTNSFVTKILIDSKKRAYGVEFVNNGVTLQAKATKEVIVSSGTINSPQLLMLSGIGPKSHLHSLKIPVVKDLQVGKCLYDHLTYVGMIFTVNQTIEFKLSDWLSPLSYVELLATGRGPLTTLGAVEAISYFKTNFSTNPDPDVPDIENIFLGAHLSTDYGLLLARGMRISDDVYDALFRPLEGRDVIGIFPMLLHPRSCGRVELRSKNPFDHPKLHGNYLTDPEGLDVKTFIAAIREIQRIFEDPAFLRYGIEQHKVKVPGCEAYDYDSDGYLECALRHIAVTLHHQQGTCKMGVSSDAVVDERLRVYGVGSLRVIDASIMPASISGHTNVPTYMVAEKGADMIKQDWK